MGKEVEGAVQGERRYQKEMRDAWVIANTDRNDREISQERAKSRGTGTQPCGQRP